MSHFTYGELTEKGIKQLMKGIDKKGKIFADMGSGKGRVCIAVAKLFPKLKKVIGVELRKDRHDEAKAMVSSAFRKKHNIKLVNGDLFEYDFHPINIMYVSNDEEMNTRLANKINREMHGGTIIFTSKRLEFTRPVKEFVIENVDQSWSTTSKIYKHMLL